MGIEVAWQGLMAAGALAGFAGLALTVGTRRAARAQARRISRRGAERTANLVLDAFERRAEKLEILVRTHGHTLRLRGFLDDDGRIVPPPALAAGTWPERRDLAG